MNILASTNMRQSFFYLSIILVAGFQSHHLTLAVEVSNAQIQNGILSLVHSYTLLENKLDRHEQRERALGEVIKRGLQTLQKGQKIFEPMRGTFSRLDERMSQLETALMAQEDRLKEQNDNTNRVFAMVEKAIQTGSIRHKSKSSENGSDEDEDNDLGKKVDNLSDNVKGLRRQLAEMVADKDMTEAESKRLLAKAEVLLATKLSSADEVISKVEEKLTHFYITGNSLPPTSPIKNTEWEDNITKSISQIIDNVEVLKDTQMTQSNNFNLRGVDKDFFVTIANETLEAIEDMRIEVLTASDKSFTKTATRIKESADNLDNSINEVLKTISESAAASEAFYDTATKSDEELKQNIINMGKMENILLENGDSLLAVKRGMEFNVHAIKFEVEDLLKSHTHDINTTFIGRFDELNQTILNNHNGALSNLTSKIETEISQVWRQIGIMHQEVQYSKEALNKLQDQTQAYVNGTFTTMDSMEGKVAQITGRMVEVDSNLNYLLGRLSLVTQEFNQIKTGLGSALDNIRSSFQIVQNKIKDAGPGPHKIEPSENL